MAGEIVDLVVFSELRHNDTIEWDTGRSKYRFTLTDMSLRKGMLVGGKVEHPREAVFSGSLLEDKSLWDNGIRVGARATFFLVVPHNSSGFSQVVTSPLLSLRWERNRAPAAG
ncbi:MAG TPA: hypothetical protein PLF26_03335 [Blastocatellia bacterium]|nr:hypothetical protein [Blastocatellia bacterium]